jgi:hypothetical protein
MKLLTITMIAVALLLSAGCKKTTVQGEAKAKLSLIKPGSVTIDRGGTAKVSIKIQKKNLEGPVTISFSQLPSGVMVTDKDLTISDANTEGTFTLMANADAGLVSGQQAQVTATGSDGTGVTETFTIAIKEMIKPAAGPTTTK